MPEETCGICNAKLDSNKSLQDHFRKHANKEIDIKGHPIISLAKEETCVLCNAKLDSKKSLQDHFRKHANKEIDMKGQPTSLANKEETCVLCNAKLDSKKSLQDHFRKHANEEIFMEGPPLSLVNKEETCVLCNAKLDSKKSLQDHFRKHANKEIDMKGRPTSTTSSIGLRPFSRKYPQNRPILNSASTSSTPSNQLTVLHCNVTQSDHSISNVASSGQDSCYPIIKQNVSTENEIEPDPRSKQSTPNSTIQHTACPAEDSGSLHCSYSTSRQRIACDICKLVFSSVARAITHKWRKHPGQPSSFHCSYCGKQFPLQTVLQKHISEEHHESKPKKSFTCGECKEVFFNEPALKYHSKLAHARIESVSVTVAIPPPSKKMKINYAGQAEPVYYCHLCGSEYIHESNLRKHLEVRHATENGTLEPNAEIIRCGICEAFFYNQKAYKIHNVYHQSEELYMTSEEHKLQTVSQGNLDFKLGQIHIPTPKTLHGLGNQKVNLVVSNKQSRLESEALKVKRQKDSDTQDNSSVKARVQPTILRKKLPYPAKQSFAKLMFSGTLVQNN